MDNATPEFEDSGSDPSCADWRFLLPLPASGRVLLAASPGSAAAELAGFFADRQRLVILGESRDEVRRLVARARACGASAEGVVAAEGLLPCADSTFDLVLDEPTDDREAARRQDNRRRFDELRRVLRPHGVYVGYFDRASAPRFSIVLQDSGLEYQIRYRTLPDRRHNSYVIPDLPAGRRFFARWLLAPRSIHRRLIRQLWGRAPRLPLPIGDTIVVAGQNPLPVSPLLTAIDPAGSDLMILAVRGRPVRNMRAHFFVLDQDGQPRVLVHVARDAADGGVQREIAMLQKVRETLPPSLQATVPRPLGLLTVHGRLASAQEILPGTNLLTVLTERPRRDWSPVIERLLPQILDWLIAFARATRTPTDLDPALLRAAVITPIQRARCLRGNDDPNTANFEQLLTAWEGEAGGRVNLIGEHGDFWPGNVIVTRSGPAVVDWDVAAFERLPGYDLFRILHAIAFMLLGDAERQCRAEEMLDLCYGGHGWYSKLVRDALDRYGSALDLPRHRLPLLLPLQLARKAALEADHYHSRSALATARTVATCLRLLEEHRVPVLVDNGDG